MRSLANAKIANHAATLFAALACLLAGLGIAAAADYPTRQITLVGPYPPGGGVDDIRVVSSELAAAELERKLLARVRQFDFAAKDVEVMVVSWPVDFLPS